MIGKNNRKEKQMIKQIFRFVKNGFKNYQQFKPDAKCVGAWLYTERRNKLK